MMQASLVTKIWNGIHEMGLMQRYLWIQGFCWRLKQYQYLKKFILYFQYLLVPKRAAYLKSIITYERVALRQKCSFYNNSACSQ